MKLSENTLTVLKNFATINSGVVLKPGNIQKSMSPEQNILVEAKLEDTFPCTFGIYDLNQFLGNVTALKNPDMDFSDKAVTMRDTDMTLRYMACSPELIISPPDKELAIVEPDVTLSLTQPIVTKLLRIASMNNLPNLSLVVKNNELNVVVHDKANDLSNHASTKIGDYQAADMTATFKTEYLKMIPDDYDVRAKVGKFAAFTSKNKNLKYFISMETR